MRRRSNTVPWSEICTLIRQTVATTAEGYEETVEASREVWCNVAEGVSTADFYESRKAGVRLSATVELWADDYEREQLLEYQAPWQSAPVRYRVYRTYPTGHGTVDLLLEEVAR